MTGARIKRQKDINKPELFITIMIIAVLNLVMNPHKTEHPQPQYNKENYRKGTK